MPAHGTGQPATPGYTLTVVNSGPDRSWLYAAGELDLSVVDQLGTALEEQRATGRRFTRLDLAAVTFLDCACLGVLVRAHHRFLAEHGTLTLTGVGPKIARLLTLTDLDQTLFTDDVATLPPDADGPPV